MITHQLKVQSTKYLLERIESVRKNYADPETPTIETIDQSLREMNHKLKMHYRQQNDKSSDDQKIMASVIEELRGNAPYTYLLNEIRNSPIAIKLINLYVKYSEAANFFWLVCIAASLVTGIVAAISTAYLPIVSYFTIALSTLIYTLYAISRNISRPLSFPSEEKRYAESQKQIRYFLKKEFQFFKNKVAYIIEKISSEKNISYKEKFPKLYARRHISISEIKNELGNDIIRDHYSEHLQFSEQIQKNHSIFSALKKIMLHTSTIFFILWFLACAFSSLSTIPQITIPMNYLVEVFSDNYFGFKLSAFVAVIISASSYLDHMINKRYYQFKCEKSGEAPYKPNKDANQHSKKQAYNIFKQRIRQLYDKLSNAKSIIVANRQLRYVQKVTSSDTTIETENFILSLKVIDVENDYYFENMKEEPNTFSIIKKLYSRIAQFVSGFQPWAYNIKNFLFTNGRFASIVSMVGTMCFGPTIGPSLTFMFVVCAFGLLGGSVSVNDYQIKKDVHHKIEFLNKLDARLSHLSKTYTKLSYACELFKTLDYAKYYTNSTTDPQPRTKRRINRHPSRSQYMSTLARAHRSAKRDGLFHNTQNPHHATVSDRTGYGHRR